MSEANRNGADRQYDEPSPAEHIAAPSLLEKESATRLCKKRALPLNAGANTAYQRFYLVECCH
jgi:hypothetical protein